ncbi:MAG: methionine adenosyltransferase, partial [Erysipelotrichaceae bacterium]|nr:methionine adenosyltransferase [Erysipelotrichaceae bacterium]
ERYLINPTGRFEIGGFEGDAGLTGRKIVVDAYQSFANVGGGCMNGKDPTKVDLSGAYMARRYAKELLEKYDLKWCEVQLSYAIGLRRPLAIYIDSDKGNLVPEEEMYERGEPKHIIEELDMKHLCYEKQAMFGHFYE